MENLENNEQENITQESNVQENISQERNEQENTEENKNQNNNEETKEEKTAETVEVVNNVGEKAKNKNNDSSKKGLGIASMILGIISIVLCCSYGIASICAVLAIVFGIIAIKSEARKMAISGIITGSIGIVIAIIMFIIMFLLGFSLGITDILDRYYDTDIDDLLPRITRNNTYEYDEERYY